MISTDGDVIMATVFVGGKVALMWRFDTLSDPVSGWADGVHYWVESTTAIGNNLMDSVNLMASTGKKVEEAGSSYTSVFSYEAFGVTEICVDRVFSAADDLDSAWPMSTVGLWSTDVGVRGKLGTLTDVWWLYFVGTSVGDYFPDAPTLKQFVVFQNLVFPWDSTTTIQTT